MCVVRRDVEPLHVVGVPGYELQPDELGGGHGLVRQSPGQPHHRTALQELQHQAHRCHRRPQHEPLLPLRLIRSRGPPSVHQVGAQ